MIDISLQAAKESTFRGAIDFFHALGIYDVILPFLLVFTIVFAILDKTRVFGTDKVGDQIYPKKNINAMTAFIIAFFVIASTRLVAILNEFLANVVMLLIIIVMFLLLIGSFYKESEDVALIKGWRSWFMAIILIVIILMFLHAVPAGSGSNWLEVAWFWLVNNWNTNVVASIILLVVIVIIMALITKDKKAKTNTAGPPIGGAE